MASCGSECVQPEFMREISMHISRYCSKHIYSEKRNRAAVWSRVVVDVLPRKFSPKFTLQSRLSTLIAE